MNQVDLNGRCQAWAAYRLGQNEFGLWLYASGGTEIRTPTGDRTGTLEAQALVIPNEEWWVASWFQDRSITASVTTPPEVKGHSIRIVDLELQVSVGESGSLRSDGIEAYESALAHGLVSPEQDGAARVALDDLVRRMGERIEPFGQIGRRWFSGITRNELHFVAYDPDWPERFREARDEILPLLPPGSRIEHVGSTSVPGLSAKDCIDIAVVVPRQEQFADVIEELETLEYESRPDAFDDPGHVFIRRLTGGHRSHHLHLYNEGHQNLIGVLAFRDLLRADPEAREQYQAVKVSLAEANPYDRSGYAAGKDAVAQELLRRALARLQRESGTPLLRRQTNG